jgi:hypothetical protein
MELKKLIYRLMHQIRTDFETELKQWHNEWKGFRREQALNPLTAINLPTFKIKALKAPVTQNKPSPTNAPQTKNLSGCCSVENRKVLPWYPFET